MVQALTDAQLARHLAIVESDNVIDTRETFADRFARNMAHRMLKDQLQQSLDEDDGA